MYVDGGLVKCKLVKVYCWGVIVFKSTRLEVFPMTMPMEVYTMQVDMIVVVSWVVAIGWKVVIGWRFVVGWRIVVGCVLVYVGIDIGIVEDGIGILPWLRVDTKAWVEVGRVGMVLLTRGTLVVRDEFMATVVCKLWAMGGWLSTLLEWELGNPRSTMSEISWEDMSLKIHLTIVLQIGHIVVKLIQVLQARCLNPKKQSGMKWKFQILSNAIY